MLKNFSKKMSMVLLCSSLIFNSMPAFASTNASPKDSSKTTETKIALDGIKYRTPELTNKFSTEDKSKTLASKTRESTTLVDGQTDYKSVGKGYTALYIITVPDESVRFFNITGSCPVKSSLIASGREQFISYDSGASRNSNIISTVLLPGMTYILKITPQEATTIAVSMSVGGNNESWVNCGNDSNTYNTTWTEKNMLLGQNTDGYGIEFQKPGTYSISVTNSISSLSLTLVGTNYTNPIINLPIPPMVYTFPTNITVTAAEAGQLNYRLLLKSNGVAHNGSAYTVTITKVS
ncbi:hypothetical protein [Clostridium sp. FP1]|uniref:hypothetical protein n=1 Tax=Clostridium sp. FP1 TaxID=2724076 RepID=UPI0013E99D1D|nr:hypothetical protein [Clostridium sp. FP1]MBZ9633204.1 hypothetical protein [Clostridium sp. FP1]